MGSETDVGTVLLGGAVATVTIWLIQWLAPSAPVTPELSVALGTIFTGVFAFVLPKNLGRRPSRTNSDQAGERLG